MPVTEISLVLFDLNGVLYQYDRAVRIAALAAISGCDEASIKAAIWDSGFEDSGDAGAVDADAYLPGFGAAIGYGLSEAAWVAALRAAIAPVPAALGLLPRIRPAVACAVLTNNNLLVQKHFSTLYPEIATRVGKRAFVSAEFGARKPEPVVYRNCLARLGVAPAAALFIDDSEANVAGAVAAGLEGHHCRGPGDLAAVLSGRGLVY
jgi:HAD superfamily hydrolase (TIGR01509 family)